MTTTDHQVPGAGAENTDLAAAARQMQQEAEELAARAERLRAEAAQLQAAAEAEAQRIRGEAGAAAGVLTTSATAAAKQSADLADRARWLGTAAEDDLRLAGAIRGRR